MRLRCCALKHCVLAQGTNIARGRGSEEQIMGFFQRVLGEIVALLHNRGDVLWGLLIFISFSFQLFIHGNPFNTLNTVLREVMLKENVKTTKYMILSYLQ